MEPWPSKGGKGFNAADIQAAAKAQGVEIRQGDVILFHTGWTDAKLESAPTEWVSKEPEITNDAAVYLASLNPMAVGADTWGVDVTPPVEGDKVFYAHVTFLKENGVYILETDEYGPPRQRGRHGISLCSWSSTTKKGGADDHKPRRDVVGQMADGGAARLPRVCAGARGATCFLQPLGSITDRTGEITNDSNEWLT